MTAAESFALTAAAAGLRRSVSTTSLKTCPTLLTYLSIQNRSRHASSPALHSSGTARCKGDQHPHCQWTMSRRLDRDRSALKESESTWCCEATWLCSVQKWCCAPTSALIGLRSPWSIRRGMMNAQGLGPWSACCVENLQGCAEGGKGTVHGTRPGCGGTAHAQQPAFPFSAPRPGLQTSDEHSSCTFLASSRTPHPNVPYHRMAHSSCHGLA